MQNKMIPTIVLACLTVLAGARAHAGPASQPIDPSLPDTALMQLAKKALAPTSRPAAAAAAATQLARATPATTQRAAATTGRATATTATVATTVAATSPGALPSPAELIAKLRAQRKERASLPRVAYFDLSERLVEKPADFTLFGDPDATTLRSLLERMRKAKDDKKVRAVLVTLGGDHEIGLAQAQELRDTLIDLNRAGKKTFVHADSFDTAGYIAASGASDVCMLEGGEIMIPGVGMEAMFAKGFLDKVGVRADYIQIGEYKGADEPYTRTAPSEQMRGEMNALAEQLYAQIIDGISLQRNLSKQDVRGIVDDAIIGGAAAKHRGLVDHLVDQDGLRDLIAAELGGGGGGASGASGGAGGNGERGGGERRGDAGDGAGGGPAAGKGEGAGDGEGAGEGDGGQKIELLHDYGQPEREQVDFSNPFALLASLGKQKEASGKPRVALIYVDGVIQDGDGGAGLFDGDGAAGSDDLRKALREAARDEEVRAIVLRIDSPGGSALASEVIWQAARRAAERKPLVISIGSMAASGGYYIASAGDHIFADPAGIVGSIGVVGGKFVWKDLYAKLGLSTETFSRGRNADLFSSSHPWTDRQRKLVTGWMKQTYDQFTQRILSTRGGKIKHIDDVARGRIFSARQAKDLGLIDEIGGLQQALAHAADQADLADGQYEVKTLPEPRTLADYFGGGAGGGGGADPDAAWRLRPSLGADALLPLLDGPSRRLVGQQLRALRLLQKHPVMLVAPFALSVR